jgi:uncharacterized protein YjcR
MLPRARSPDRDKAKEIYLERNGNVPLNEIASMLGLSEGTIRGWKAKDDWDASLNGTERTSSNNATLRSNKKEARSAKDKNNSSYNKGRSDSKEKKAGKKGNKTDSKSYPNRGHPGNQFAKGNKGGRGGPVGNKHALGNKGGHGGPIRNKKAIKTGEYETVFYNGLLSEEERALLDKDYDKYVMLFLLIDTLTIREMRILKRIKDTEQTPGGMVFDSVKKTNESQTTSYTRRGEEGEESYGNSVTMTTDNSTHTAVPSIKRVQQFEEALTRVQGRKAAAIAQLHRMERDDTRIAIDQAKLELYKQRLSGRLDIGALLDGDDDLEMDDQLEE